jgi:phospholipase A-2-activating protein
MVFNKDNRLIAAEWSAVSGVWIEVGDVTGSSDNGTIDGVYYDHVMPVEIDGVGGSVMKLELGYNNMENPYEAAQRFIDKNDLPQHHLKQIADWISTKAGKQTPTLGPQGATIQNNSTAIQQSNPKYQYLPLSAYVIFSEVMSGLRSKLIPKITEFNNSQEDISKKLTEPEMHALTDLVRILEETSYYHSSIISGIHLNILYKMITQWNMPHTFPAYDLLRLVCIHAQGSKILSSYPHLFILLDHASNSFSSTESPASSLCASRFIGNSFRYEEMRMAVLKNLSFLQTLIVKMKNVLISSQNKSLRLAASNIALNLSLSCQNIPPGGLISKVNIICGLISAMIECLDHETNASEYISRYLIAIGTSILTQKDSAIIRDLKTFCQSQNLVEKLLLMRQNVAVTNDVNLTKCIEEFTDLISR